MSVILENSILSICVTVRVKPVLDHSADDEILIKNAAALVTLAWDDRSLGAPPNGIGWRRDGRRRA